MRCTVRCSIGLSWISLAEASDVTTVLVTGDNWATAQQIAAQLGIGEVDASTREGGYRETPSSGGRVAAFVADGVNDGPALATADLVRAMGLFF
jgi:Cu+-exporting ATPase